MSPGPRRPPAPAPREGRAPTREGRAAGKPLQSPVGTLRTAAKAPHRPPAPRAGVGKRTRLPGILHPAWGRRAVLASAPSRTGLATARRLFHSSGEGNNSGLPQGWAPQLGPAPEAVRVRVGGGL